MLKIGPREFEWGAHTIVMGILNITPDSFSGDGLLQAPPNLPPLMGGDIAGAVDRARAFLAAGAEILDIGGESTRPSAKTITAEEELERVIPVIRAIAAEFPDAVISIDTYKATVAQTALEAGAHLVNDVWGLRADPALADVVAQHNVPVVLMHNRSKSSNAQVQTQLGGRYVGVEYTNLIADVKADLMESIAGARAAGIRDEQIILDPGLGFGKTVGQNLELLNRLDEIRALGFPLLLGPSRKSFIGYTLNLPPDQRVEGTAAAVAIGIARGADIVRVHDVEMMTRVARMTDAIVRRKA